MEGLLLLAGIVFIVVPIASLITTLSMNNKVAALEKAVTELKKTIEDGALSAPKAERTERTVPDAATAAKPVHWWSEFQSVIAGGESGGDEQATPAQAESIAPEEEPAAEPLLSASSTDESLLTDEGDEEWTVENELVPEEQLVLNDAAARAPTAQREPSWLSVQYKKLYSWLLSEGNIWVTVGVVLFLAGFGLLFSYVAQLGLFPLEMRLAAAAVVGIGITAFGWKMRERRRTYALILQGGGIGILYIVLLAGAKLGGVIPPSVSIIGMLLLSIFTIILAVLQDYELLACFALLGGYAAPILVSTGSSNFVALFAIYTLLNIEILCITALRNWRKARWGGLIASVVVGAIWGALRWDQSYFARVEPFLLGFFATYTAITLLPLLADRIKQIKNRDGVDFPMIVSLPFIFLSLQIPAAYHTDYFVPISCIGIGVWYMLLGRFAMRSEQARRAGYSPRLFLSFCILFSNLAIPFIFKQSASSAIWALEGAVLVAVAARRGEKGAFACGVLMHIAAVTLYTLSPHWSADVFGVMPSHSGIFGLNDPDSPFLLSGAIFALSALASSFFCTKLDSESGGQPERVRLWKFDFALPGMEVFTRVFAGYGTLWYALFTYHAAQVKFPDAPLTQFALLCLGGAAGFALSLKTGWKQSRYLAVLPTASLFSLFLVSFATGYSFSLMRHVLYISGYYTPIDWLWSKPFLTVPLALAFFAMGYLSYRRESPTRLSRRTWFFFLLTAVYYVCGLASHTLVSGLETRVMGLADLISFLPIPIAVELMTRGKYGRAGLPEYRTQSLYALVALMLWRLPLFISSFFMYNFAGARYIPILHPVDLMQLGYMVTAGLMLNAIPSERIKKIGLHYALPVVAFIWTNAVAARIAAVYFGEYAHWGTFSHSPHFQGIIAIIWGFTALALIFGAKKFSNRFPWFLGAGLLALDIVKLMAIDLRNSATIIRIFAFLLLGGLFLVIGWIAPLPPRRDKGE